MRPAADESADLLDQIAQLRSRIASLEQICDQRGALAATLTEMLERERGAQSQIRAELVRQRDAALAAANAERPATEETMLLHARYAQDVAELNARVEIEHEYVEARATQIDELSRACEERLTLIEELQRANEERLDLINELQRSNEERLALINDLDRTCRSASPSSKR